MSAFVIVGFPVFLVTLISQSVFKEQPLSKDDIGKAAIVGAAAGIIFVAGVDQAFARVVRGVTS